MEPKLRFKEFSGDWEEKKFKQVINSFDYGMNSSAVEFDGENKYIRITDIDENTHRYLNNNIVSPSGKLEDKYIVQKNDILFARTGASTGKTYLYDEKDGKLYFAGFLIRGNVKEEYNSYFVFNQTLTENYNKWVYLISMRSGQPGINSNEYGNYKCKFPSLAEQTKIADFLSIVDEKIQNQQDKITHLENIKKGFMQKIFSRNVRFKDDNGNEFPEWEEKKLGHRVEEYNFKTIKQNQYPILSSTKSGIYLQSEYFNKQAASENTLGYKIVPKGYFTYRSMSDTGEFTFNIQNIINNGIVSPAYPVFKADKDNSIFLQLLLNNSNFIKKQLLVLKEGGTRYALSFEKFCKLKVFIPCLEEQQKIADFLSSFGEKIDVEKDTLEHLKEMKKGLLQQMFV